MKPFLLIFVIALAMSLGTPKEAQARETPSLSTATLAINRVPEPALVHPEDKRVKLLRGYLVSHKSPLADVAGHFVSEADKHNLDWKLVAAIAGVESTFGKHIPAGSYNGWGWGIPTGASYGIAFADWKNGISEVSEGLRHRYIDRGAVTIEQIGRIYAASPAWPWKVRFFLAEIEQFSNIEPQDIDITL
ncbi:MAG: hypothetical protein Q7S76_03710 [bacterium]|nr:hypothetical protein [bacterium]